MSDSNSPPPDKSRPKGKLSMPEGARYAGCSPRHFYGLAYKDEIPTYFASGHRWVDVEDIDAYFARQKAKGPQFRVTGKRKLGRPKKPRTEQSASAGDRR